MISTNAPQMRNPVRGYGVFADAFLSASPMLGGQGRGLECQGSVHVLLCCRTPELLRRCLRSPPYGGYGSSLSKQQ